MHQSSLDIYCIDLRLPVSISKYSHRRRLLQLPFAVHTKSFPMQSADSHITWFNAGCWPNDTEWNFRERSCAGVLKRNCGTSCHLCRSTWWLQHSGRFQHLREGQGGIELLYNRHVTLCIMLMAMPADFAIECIAIAHKESAATMPSGTHALTHS